MAELENAKRLCEAAGITVEARLDDGTGTSAHPLLAHVLREATTNLLRHVRPTIVTITASPGAVEVSNDGVIDAAGSPLRGLARLRERVESAGGTLRIEWPPGRFVVTARIDPVPAAGEPRLGLPAGPRRARHTRHQGDTVHSVGDPQAGRS
ncbi:hypothetical protein ACIBO2_12705 [Nonomuraea sp. NPDC050022]|uniref:hypothetical protein n=1 Tax=unclassified Nonomuraea TaxID=2593643 RepID=UPI0033E033E6